MWIDEVARFGFDTSNNLTIQSVPPLAINVPFTRGRNTALDAIVCDPGSAWCRTTVCLEDADADCCDILWEMYSDGMCTSPQSSTVAIW